MKKSAYGRFFYVLISAACLRHKQNALLTVHKMFASGLSFWGGRAIMSRSVGQGPAAFTFKRD